MVREALKPDLRALLGQQGFTLAAAERAAGLAQGSLSRLLAGRRGKGLQLDTVLRLSRGTGIPLAALVEALKASVADAQERRQRVLEVERARLEAELW